MKNGNTAYVLKLTGILLAITVIVALLLGGVYSITEAPIAAYKAEKTNAAIRTVLSSQAEPEIVPADRIKDGTGLVKTLWKVGEDGYVAELVVGGSQADIDMMVGVDASGKVSGISFISMSETSGLGAVAAQQSTKGEAFRNQFIGRSGELAVNKDGGEIDALSGATVTSRAVTRAVNAALACEWN